MRRVRTEELVAVGDRPAFVREDGHRNDDLVHDAVVPGLTGPPLGFDGVRVGGLLRQVREGVVEVLGGLPHDGRRLVDQPLGNEARVEVDVGAHRVVAHVLDAADEDDVCRAHGDLTGAGRRRGERAGAHAVDREPGDGRREPREERDVATEREALVADLRGRREDDVVDPLGRKLRVASEHLAHGLDGHVVRARLREEAVRLSRGRTPCARRRRRPLRGARTRPRRYFRRAERLGGTSARRAGALRGRSRAAARGMPTSGSASSRGWATRPGPPGFRC